MRWKRVLSVLGIFAGMAVLGAVAGRLYLNQLETKNHDRMAAAIDRGEASLLRPGQAFPELDLVDAAGAPTRWSAAANGRSSLILLVSLTCDPCLESLGDWARGVEDSTVSVFAIADGLPSAARAVAASGVVPFPILCDSTDVLGRVYGLQVVPTVVGVGENGTIRFIRHGLGEAFTPQVALRTLASGEAPKS